jgi:glycosyltransferase involved in cell wall biosynthesis
MGVPVSWLPSWLPGRSRAFHGSGIESNLMQDPLAALSIPPFLASFALEASIRAMFADVILAHWLLPMGAVGALVARSARIPLRILAHSGPPALARIQPFRGLVRSVVSRAVSVACVSDSVRDEVGECVGPELSTRLDVLSLGVDLRPCIESAHAPGQTFRVLFVGRLVRMKGVDLLLRALSGMTGVVLTVLGDGPEGGRLRRMAAEFSVNATFAGEVDHDTALGAMQSHDLLVIPSRSGMLGREEGLPRVLLEAWSCGLPVVAAATGGLRGAILSRGGGLLCAPDDSGGLGNAIRAVRQDERLRARLQAEGMEEARKCSWDVLGPRWAAWVAGRPAN